MTESTIDPVEDASGEDESAFGAGGITSHDADAPTEDVPVDVTSGGADGGDPDSHAADVDAGYDDPSDSPTSGGPDAVEDGTL
jgi:hypothetical protein